MGGGQLTENMKMARTPTSQYAGKQVAMISDYICTTIITTSFDPNHLNQNMLNMPLEITINGFKKFTTLMNSI